MHAARIHIVPSEGHPGVSYNLDDGGHVTITRELGATLHTEATDIGDSVIVTATTPNN